MSKPKRNDPCPCGSGKKYKKCCGKNNVIPFNSALYIKEINNLYTELINFVFGEYDNELSVIADMLKEEFYPVDNVEDSEIYTELVKGWAVFNAPIEEKETMFDIFYKNVNKQIKYPGVKKTFKEWSTPRTSVFEVFLKKEYVKLKDLETGDYFKISLDEGHGFKEGNLAVGLLIPYTDHHEFFNVMMQLPGDFVEIVINILGEKLPSDLTIAEVFPEFLAELLLLISGPGIDLEMFDWYDIDHEIVAKHFLEHAVRKGYDAELIHMTIQYWSDYCHINYPIVRKHAAHAAALDYFSQVEFSPFTDVTQAQLAKEYGTSAGTISNHYNRLSDEYEIVTELVGTETASPSHQNMEKHLRDLMRTIEEQDFDSEEELDEFLQSVMKLDELPASESPRDIAQDLLFDAQEATGTKRQELIQEALEIYPDSSDAYLLLAEDERNIDREIKLLKKAIQVGEKDLGKEFFLENRGYFWGIVETRPYMRAKAAYAMALDNAGLIEEAIQTYEDLLELNPNDNQGIRYLLLPFYLEEDLDKAHQLLEKYDEPSATFEYSKALLMYKEEGITTRSIKALKDAKKNNPYVIDYLLGRKRIPVESPRYVGMGDESEAIAYVQENIHLWEDAQEFLKRL